MKAKRLLLLTILCATLSISSFTQTIIGRQNVDQYPTTWWGTMTYGLTWLPNDYSTNLSQKYPLIIFLHGVGETGNGVSGLYTMLNAGLPKTISQGWDPEAINPVDGQNYKFIVVSPQASTSVGWSYQWNSIQYILPDVINRYRVDTTRIYVTGLSAGGNGTWTCLTSGPDAAKKFAAAVPIASAPLPLDSIPLTGSQYGVKLWQICGDQDAFYNFSTSSTASYNSGTPVPNPSATLTVFPGQGHWPSVWDTSYDPAWTSNVHNKNIYQWMLQYKRTSTTTPLTVNAGSNQNITLPVSTVVLNGSVSTPAGDTITSYAWSKLSGPAGDVIANQNAMSTQVNNLVQGIYTYQLTVISSANDTASASMQVTVNQAPNTLPVVNAGNDQVIQLPVDSVQLNGTAIDSDGTINAYQWSKVSGPASFVIVSSSQPQTIVNGLVPGIYQFELMATDNNGASDYDTVMITVNQAAVTNIPPTANAGLDTSITLPLDSVLLNGSGSDADGTITNYLWSKISGPAAYTFNNASQQQNVVTNLTQGIYLFQLQVTDDSGAIAMDTVSITVLAAQNIPPTANAGSDMVITLPVDSIFLNGSGIDNDGSISSYQWTKITGPSNYFIQQANNAQTVVDSLVQGTYKFELTVTDNLGAVAKDTMVVIVNAPSASICNGVKRYLIPNSGDHGKQISGDSTSWWYMQVNAGDTLVLQSQHSWTYLRMENYYGTSACPIVVMNEGGQVWMRDGIDATNVHHLKITGSGAANTYYGFKVYNPVFDGYSVAIGISGKTKNVEVERVDVLHKGYGVWAKQDPQCDQSFNYPNYVMDSIEIHHSRFKRIWQDCIYAGNTDPLGDRIVWCNGVETHPIPMRMSNVNIHHLIIDSCGRTGIQLSGADAGINRISDNIVTNCGYEYNQWQGTGISIGGMTRNCYVYNNVVRNTFLYGIFDLGADSSFVYNNVIDSSGYLKIDPTVDINALAASTNTTALPGHWLKNTMSLPGNIQATTRNSIPHYTKTIFYKDNKVGVNASTIAPDGIIQIGWWGPAEDWTTNNKICNNTKLNGSPAKIDPFWYTTLNQYWPVFDSLCTSPVPNMPPSANAGNDTTITIDSVMLLGSGTDHDGSIVAFHWEKIGGPSSFNIVHADSAHTMLTSLLPGTYTLRLTVTDNNGMTASDDVQVFFNTPNNPPITNAGPYKVITLPVTSLTLNGSAIDPDGDTLSFSWTKIQGPANYSFSSANQPVTTASNLVPGIYLFELKVTDQHGAVDKDTTRVDVNIAPTANAGPDQTITLPVNSVNVNGIASDVDGTLSTFTWTKISGPSQFTIASPNNPQTSITNLAQGVYLFEFKVTDNFDAPARDTLMITVLPGQNLPPVANAGNDITIQLPVNSTQLNGSGTDSDGTINSYSWTKISGPASFVITSPTQAQTAITGLQAGVYEFQLTVTDNGAATAVDVVQVTVLAAVNLPPVANAGTDVVITLPVNSVPLNGSATDQDGTIASYQWTKIAGPSSFNILNASQAQTTVTTLVQGVYYFELKVTDNGGAVDMDTVMITVNSVTPVNQVPVANAGTDITITLPVDNVMLNGSGSDADGTVVSYVWNKISGPASFVIVSSTQPQTMISSLVQGVYQFELVVTDNNGATGKDTVMVTVNAAVPSVNNPPVANAGNDQQIIFPTTSALLSGSGTDTDGSIVSYKWTKISGPVVYNIADNNQAQTMVSGLLQGSVYGFELTVTDDDGATGKDTVLITVSPASANMPPHAHAGQDRTILWPQDTASIAGDGTDPDGTITSYKWTKISGPIQYNILTPNMASTELSNLVEGTYEFELRVTDNWGAVGRDTIKVMVVNNARIFTNTTLYPNPATTEVNVRIVAQTEKSQSGIRIYDSRGSLVYAEDFVRTQKIMERKINVSNLVQGTYVIVVKVDIDTQTGLKFIKH